MKCFFGMSLILALLLGSRLNSQTSVKPNSGKENAEIHLLRGQAHLEKGRNQEALVELKQALVADSTLVEVRYHLGLAQWNLGHYSEAAENFKKTLELSPDHVPSAYYLGQIFLQRNDLPKATEFFERALRAGGAKPPLDLYFQLGKTYLAQGDLEAGIRVLEQGSSLYGKDDRVYTQLGKAYLKLGRKGEAEKALVKSRELRDYQREATSMLLRCSEYLKSNEVDKALEIYRQILSSDDVDDLVALGINFSQNRFFDEAEQLFRKAASVAPESFEANYNLGMVLLQMQKREDALEKLGRAAELRPYSFEASSVLGVMLSQSGNNEQAIRELVRAEQLRPGEPKVLTLLGLQLIQGRYYAEAISTLRRGVELHPENTDLRFLLVQAYYQHHDFERALQEAQSILSHLPGSARANFEVGFQLKNFGRFHESEPYFLKAISIDAAYTEALSMLGELRLIEGKYEEALSYFQKAIGTDRSQIDSYLGAAKALLNLQSYPDLIDLMRKAEAIDPKNPQPHLHLSQAYRALGQNEEAVQEAEVFKRLNAVRMTQRDEQVEREFRER
jgi:tetratricopeptide (TPR) repeat protein